MEFKETSKGVLNYTDEKNFRYVIVNSFHAPKHKYAGKTITLTVGKPDYMFVIGEFYGVDFAKEAAANVQKLINALV